LRARRDHAGDGRVYLVVVTSTDPCGNVGVGCKSVVVPRSGSVNNRNCGGFGCARRLIGSSVRK
jgi:hypothetical protein